MNTQTEPKERVNLRKLDFSPNLNPFVHEISMKMKKKKVFTQINRTLADVDTGEILGSCAISVTEIDKKAFIKIFAELNTEKQKLTLSARQVLEEVLQIYMDEPMRGGYADSVYIYFMENKNKECILNGNKISFSLKTLQRGLKEIIEGGLIYPKSPNVFWINPHLYFKGDRILFLKEYRLKVKELENTMYPKINLEKKELEIKQSATPEVMA
ncbi:hypothetical protein [Perlucidibaca aquatica]|uniref:hypothetical protein n=1 Tax=Perlucidibaca aquatica TaxID=1852776 RepID=UPI0012FE303E|nr:hypothetical protein [Perlucidibaca aquatica]